jgi:hypothetical protein
MLAGFAFFSNCLFAEAAGSRLISDQLSPVGAQLCLAVDGTKPLVPAPGATVIPPADGKPILITDIFYPIIVARCDTLDAKTPALWTATDARELRVSVNNKPMCLSARYMSNFVPLLDPYLAAFDANKPGTTFAYLVGDLKKGGTLNEERLRANPDFVAAPCGRGDAADHWLYDELSGTVSGSGGWDDKRSRARRCVTIHGDWTKRPPLHDAGMPVSAADCASDLRSYSRVGPAHQHWQMSEGKAALPTYLAPNQHDYFSGAAGLPIVGPLGRCLTADPSGLAVTSDCDGRVEQNWKIVGNMIKRGEADECLTREANGAVKVNLCNNVANQQWLYSVKEPTPNPAWLRPTAYGRIAPIDNADQCLAVTRDPFADPARQRNPLRLAVCASEPPLKTSWFEISKVRTIRVAVLRHSDNDGSNPAMGKASDAAIKATVEELVLHLSEQYQVAGVRFVFDPEHDFLKVNDTVANQQVVATPDGKPDYDPGNRIQRVAAQTMYGKLTISLAIGMQGGASSGNLVEFEPAKSIDPIGRWPIPELGLNTQVPKDKAGLPAIGYHVAERSLSASAGTVQHEAHELGHYFGLGHTFDRGHLGDTPDDMSDGKPLLQLGSVMCGNLQTVTVNGRPITSDKLNNESYWGCNLGRTHNSLSPLQLGKISWELDNFLNRYPLVACQPLGPYDANRVECENQESLALCQQTSSALKTKTGTGMECQLGGTFTRAMTSALQYPAVRYLLEKTPDGAALIKKLAGDAPHAALPPQKLSAVLGALSAGKNLPLTMAMVNRLKDLRDLSAQRSPGLAKSGFVVQGEALTAGDQRILNDLAKKIITPAFVANVPSILSQ